MTPPLPVPISLNRSGVPSTADQLLWEIIKDRTEALAFNHYSDFIDRVLSDAAPGPVPSKVIVRSQTRPRPDWGAVLRELMKCGDVINSWRLQQDIVDAYTKIQDAT